DPRVALEGLLSESEVVPIGGGDGDDKGLAPIGSTEQADVTCEIDVKQVPAIGCKSRDEEGLAIRRPGQFAGGPKLLGVETRGHAVGDPHDVDSRFLPWCAGGYSDESDPRSVGRDAPRPDRG